MQASVDIERPVVDAAAAPGLGRPDVKFGTAVRWSYLLMTGGNVLASSLTFVIAAILSPREFGVLTTAMVWVALALVLLEHGPTIAVIQQDDITDAHVNAAFWSTLAGTSGYAVLLAAAAPLWAAVNGLPELIPVCLALAPFVVLQGLNIIPEAVLRRQLRMRGIALRVLTANLVAGVAAIACALAGFGVWALVVQQLAWPTLYGILLWTMVDWRPRFGPIRGPLRDIRRTSLQTYAGAVGGYLSSRMDVVFMGALFGPVVMGLYFFASRLAETVSELTSGGLRLISLPHLSRHGRDTVDLDRELRRLMYGIGLLAFPALGILAGLARPLLLFVGEQWSSGAGALVVLCVTVAVTTTVTILGVTMQARQRAGIPAIFTWITMGCAAVAILLSARLSAGGDTPARLMAVAAAMLIVQVSTMVGLGYVVFRRVLRVPVWPTVAVVVPGLVAAVLAAAAGAGTYHVVDAPLNRFLDLAVSGTVAGIVAVATLLLLDRSLISLLRGLRSREAWPGRRRRPGD